MKNGLAKRFAILFVMIAVLLCMPLCGLAAEYVKSNQILAFNQGDEVMVAMLADAPDSYADCPEFQTDWNGDGVLSAADYNDYIIVEWSAAAGTIASEEGFSDGTYPDGTVVVGNPLVWLADLKPEDEGKTVSMKLTTPNGDTYTSIWTLNYTGLVADTPVVTVSEGDYSFTYSGKNKYKLTVQDGAEVSVDTMDYYDQSRGEYTELYSNLYETVSTDEESTLISSRYKETNWPMASDDEFSFIASVDKQVKYNWSLRVVHQNGLRGSRSITIDVEVVDKDANAPTAYYNHEHSFYFNQNGETDVFLLLGEMPDVYAGLSEFKRDWDGDGVMTADECNENVQIEWSTTAGQISSTQKFATTSYDDTLIACPVAWVSNLKPEDDGKTVTMKLTNPNGDTFTADFTLYYSGWIHNTPVITTDDEEFEFVYTGEDHYKLTVADGANVSVDFTDCIDTNYDLFQGVTRTIREVDPATGTTTVISENEFAAGEFVDTNAADTEDDELSFVVSADSPKNYRCNFQVIVSENRMIANSTIQLDVEVRQEEPEVLVSNIPVYLMTSDNAQQIICSCLMFMSHDSSLSSEQKDAWWEVYDLAQNNEADITWHSENAQLDALIEPPVEQEYLKIRGNGLDAFLNETIIATFSKDGATLGVINFNIQNETIEMITWHEPTITPEATIGSEYPYHAVYTINAVEGETVTIKMNCTYSGDINYVWTVNGDQSNTTDTYSFVAAMEHDGTYVSNAAGRADFDNTYSNTKFEYNTKFYINVVKPITLTVTPKGGDLGWMPDQNTKYMYEGETIPFVAEASYEGEAVELTYAWYLETRDADGNVTESVQLDCSESTYNLTASMDHSQKYLTCCVEGEGLAPASSSVKLSVTYRIVGDITLNVESSHPVVDDVLTVTEGENITIVTNPSSPLEDAEYHHFWIIETRDENGKPVSGERLDNNTDTLSLAASADLDGMYLNYSVGADRLNPASFAYQLNVEPKAVEPEETILTANVTVKMGESETNKQLWIQTSYATRDESLTDEERSAWNDVLSQSGNAYAWTSEDAYVQSIIDKLVTQADQNTLMFVKEDSDLSSFLGQTISCAILQNDEQVAVINFYVDPVTIEIPAYRDPTTVPAYEEAEDGRLVITVTEGEMVTIQMNHTYSKPLTYRWYINEEQIEHSESSYSFTATLDDDGKVVRSHTSSGIIEGLNYGISSSCPFVIKVLPKELAPITLTITPKGGDLGWMPDQNTKYMYEGETIPFVAEASYEGETVELTYAWYLETRDADGNVTESVKLDGTESTYNLTASMDHSQKYLTCCVEGEGLVPASSSVKLSVTYRNEGEITLDVESSHPVADDVLTATEGETITLTVIPSSPLQDAQYMYFWFLEERDENGETIAEEKLDCNGDTLTLTASEALNGKYIYCSVGADRLKPGSFAYQLNVEPKPAPKPITLTITPKGGDLGWMPNQNTKYMYEGETIPFVAAASYEGEAVELTYAWYLETRDADGNVTESVKLDGTESTYNLTASMDHSQKYLTCYVEGEGLVPASSSVKLSVTYRNEGEITLDVESSHPVADDVLTATEGETITLTVTPSSPLQDAQYMYFWFLEEHDENGETIAEKKLDCTGAVLSIAATADLDGKYIYCSVGADRLKPGSFTYQLKVLPKPVEPEEEYKTVIEEGITSDALSEELKANPNLDTPEKVEADITIKVLAEATAAGVKPTSEQTAVYDVTLMYSEDGGETFVEATKENWPESGKLTVTLPYPEGTGRYTHTFVVAHMFTETTEDHKAGDIEYPAVTNTANGIQFEVTGLSPIAVAWEEKPVVADVPATGDSATPVLWMIGMLAAAFGCTALISKRRQHN